MSATLMMTIPKPLAIIRNQLSLWRTWNYWCGGAVAIANSSRPSSRNTAARNGVHMWILSYGILNTSAANFGTTTMAGNIMSNSSFLRLKLNWSNT